MKVYTIIGGVNGCGKSSLVGSICKERTDLGIIIDVDQLNAKFGSAILGGKAAVRQIKFCMESGTNFTQETTLSGIRTLQTIKKAKELGYYIRLCYVGLDTAEESLARINNRVSKGGHNIPAEDVKRRFLSRFEDLNKILPFCDEARFYDNANGFCVVAEYQNGRIIPQVERLPDWLKEFCAWQEKERLAMFTDLVPDEPEL